MAGNISPSSFMPPNKRGSMMQSRLLWMMLLAVVCPAQAHSQSPIPVWARARWETFARTRSVQLSSHVANQALFGDFDGDGIPDVALLIEHRITHKIGIAFLHGGATTPSVIGAGTDFGNGGDNFVWMDRWNVAPRSKSRAVDAIYIERESSASALIYYVNGKYRWKQLGD